jgi:hypothetical protein
LCGNKIYEKGLKTSKPIKDIKKQLKDQQANKRYMKKGLKTATSII